MLQLVDRAAYAVFRRACLDARTRVVSVDIFDTVLLRTTRPEFARFLDIGARQLAALKEAGRDVRLRAEDLLVIRIMSAQAAYRNVAPVGGIREAKYEQIVGIMLKACGLPDDLELVEILTQVELDYEANVMTPNRLLVDILEEARRAGKRIIGVSDMYLSAECIVGLLDRHGLSRLLDALYSSADFGYGKSSRRLYEQVLSLEDVAPQTVAHCGDNHTSDYKRAKEVGLHSVWTPRPLLWRWLEKRRRESFNRRHGLASL